MPRFVELPPNLCADKKIEGRSIYYRDYCYRYRTRKPIYKSASSYLSTFGKNANPQMLMSDHYSTLPLGYTQNEYNETLQRINNGINDMTVTGERCVSNHDKKKMLKDGFIDRVPGSLEKIEKAWVNEVDTNKRERGMIYGLAGKKMSVADRKNQDLTETKKSLPGLDKWLHIANEYEKQVVHKFITDVSGTLHQTPINTKNESCKLRSNSAEPVPLENTFQKVRFDSPPKSAPPLLSQRSTLNENTRKDIVKSASAKREIWIPPAGVSIDNESVASISSDDIEREKELVNLKNVSTQIPYNIRTIPSSPMYTEKKTDRTHRRSITSPAAPLKHSCQNCEACKKKIYERMLKQYEISKSTNEMLDDYVPQEKESPTYMYHPTEDYVHDGSSFQRISRYKKDYFIIHPDFVSENSRMNPWGKKMHKKYFGSSVAT